MKKYMQTAGTNPVPFQEVVIMTSAEWDVIAKKGDLSPYIGKTVFPDHDNVAYYVLDDKRYVEFPISDLKG